MRTHLKRVEKKLRRQVDERISCERYDGSIKLVGTVNTWDDVVTAGYIAARYPYREVINDLKAETVQPHPAPHTSTQQVLPQPPFILNELYLTPEYADVTIIGAGIIGSAIARELSKYELKVLLLEKEYDVGVHASSRNDGMIHPGIASKAGTLKAKMNVRGVELYQKISKELEVPIRWCGSTILFESHISRCLKPFFWIKARRLGMKGLKFLSKQEVYRLEPHLRKGVKWAVLCEASGVTSPYKMTIAYAENAIENGVKLLLNTEVLSIEMPHMNTADSPRFKVNTHQGVIHTRLIINAAGVHTDEIAQMVSDRFYTIHPRKGDVVLFDKKKSELVHGILGYMKDRSSKNTKGGGIIKTYEGNILVGPNAKEIPERECYATDKDSLNELLRQKLPQIPELHLEDDITYFTGIRAATYKEDFIIEASQKIPCFIHVAGIQSPGFASAPAIAERVEQLTLDAFETVDLRHITQKEQWHPKRKAIPILADLTPEERSKRIQVNPDYGEIVCRCEEISKGEIIDALRGPIPVDTVDGVKRRVRAGMGRCQGGFCLPLVMAIIHEEKGVPMTHITQKSGQSKIVQKETKSTG